MVENGLQDRGGSEPIRIIHGHDAAVAEWVGERLGCPGFGDCIALGIARGTELIGGVVYNNARTDGDGAVYTLEMSIATVDKSWCNRRILRALFAMPFLVLQCKRITVTVDAADQEIRRFDERLSLSAVWFIIMLGQMVTERYTRLKCRLRQ